MPTPMPIIVATCGVKFGVGTAIVHRLTPASATATPMRAVRMGRPIATSEPKLSSRMTAAATRPSASVEGTPPLLNQLPPNSVRRPTSWSGPARLRNSSAVPWKVENSVPGATITSA